MSPRDRAEMERWVRSPSTPAGLVMRVRFGSAAADSAGTVDIVCGSPMRQSRTAFCRLLRRLIRRPGATDPDHEYVADPPSTGTLATGGTHPPG
jgi:hypothetical protein